MRTPSTCCSSTKPVRCPWPTWWPCRTPRGVWSFWAIRQLEQPQKGSHPDGVGVSVLDHILGEQATMPEERGLFLPITWRLAPPLCRATSELFYEGKLSSAVGVDQVRLSGAGRFEGAGVWMIEVPHEGNRSASDEEVDEVVRLIDEIRGPAAEWVDSKGQAHPIVDADILVVAPYNAQVNRVA